jgi:integrase
MRWRSPPLPERRTGTVTCYREKLDLSQTHKLTRDTLRALVAYLTLDAPPAAGPLLLGSRKDGTLAGRMSTRAINKRVGVLRKVIGIANLSPHDCRHCWTTAAIRGGSDIKSVQEGGVLFTDLVTL